MITTATFDFADVTYGKIRGYINVAGLLDRTDADGVFRQGPNLGQLQARYTGQGWQDVTPTNSEFHSSGWSGGARTVYMTDVKSGMIELRVCHPAEGCSPSYFVSVLPRFVNPVVPSHAAGANLATRAQPTLRYNMGGVEMGGITFFVTSLHGAGSSLTHLATWVAQQTIACPNSSSRECEVRVPEEALAKPGVYFLTATSPLGSSQDMVRFEVYGVPRALEVNPASITSKSDTVLSVGFDGQYQMATGTTATLSSSLCAAQPLPVTVINERYVHVTIPAGCIPAIGSGTLALTFSNIAGAGRVDVPYSMPIIKPIPGPRPTFEPGPRPTFTPAPPR